MAFINTAIRLQKYLLYFRVRAVRSAIVIAAGHCWLAQEIEKGVSVADGGRKSARERGREMGRKREREQSWWARLRESGARSAFPTCKQDAGAHAGRNGACPNRQQIIYHLFLNCRRQEKLKLNWKTERQKKAKENTARRRARREVSSIAQHRRDGCPRFFAFYYKQSQRIFTWQQQQQLKEEEEQQQQRQLRCTTLRKIRGKIQIPNGKSKTNFQICAVQFVSKCSMYEFGTSMSPSCVCVCQIHTHTHVGTCTTCARVSVCLEYWESGVVDFSAETVCQEDSSKLISENSKSKSGTTKKRRREGGSGAPRWKNFNRSCDPTDLWRKSNCVKR